MNPFLRTLAVLVAGLALAGSVRADSPFGHTPHPRYIGPDNAVPVRFEASVEAKEITLIIPRKLLGKAKRLEGVGKKASASGGASILTIGLTVAVLALSGIGFFHLQKRPGLMMPATALVLVGILTAGRCAALAEEPVKEGIAVGKVTVKVVDDGDVIHLVVPKSQLADWAARLPAPEKKKKTP